MYPDRLRSIVPMFGGGDSFVETLEAIVRFVDEADPDTVFAAVAADDPDLDVREKARWVLGRMWW